MKNSYRNFKKAFEALIFVANMDNRAYWILKTLYFADKMHLSSYGRQIYSDSYRAMKHGPVPSLAYDIIKTARGDGYLSFQASELLGEISVPDKYTVIPKREADIKYLSKTDINCLIKAHEKVKDLDFGELKKASHDKAYDAVEQDEEISLLNIIESLENSKEILEYLNS